MLKFLSISVLLMLFMLAFPRDALAYIDPGLGSLIIQMVIASVLGVAYFFKQHWLKLMASLKNLFSKSKKNNDP